jgi:site-specific DNA recombinase
MPWQRRPEATALLAELKKPDRGFDAVVIGEPHRAFYGNQYGLTFPIFEHHGVPLWVPEVGGPIDPANEAHDLVMSVFGGMSKGERNRVKIRVRTAMASQAQIEGRFLGGRPPYGYLTRDGIPSPSAHDPARNTHRSGIAWAKSAVRAILTSPRYTGHQVWNRQRTDEVLLDVENVALGHMARQRWNPADKWVVSEQQVHPLIITKEDFELAQATLTGRGSKTQHRPHSRPRAYALRGVLHCGLCGREMSEYRRRGRPGRGRPVDRRDASQEGRRASRDPGRGRTAPDEPRRDRGRRHCPGRTRAGGPARFAGQLAADRVPSVRAIRAQLHVGQPRAQRLRDYLATRTARRVESLAA